MCPREESNLNLILRTDLFYPLNYEDIVLDAAYLFSP